MAVRRDLARSLCDGYYVSSEYPDQGTRLQTVLVVYEDLVICHSGSMYSGIVGRSCWAVDDLLSF